jgi:hypothetical protein
MFFFQKITQSNQHSKNPSASLGPNVFYYIRALDRCYQYTAL